MDIASYRLNERLAKASIPSWRLKALHGAHVFRNVGFPIEIDSADELFNILDTMHENQFDAFVTELNGLDDHDFVWLVDALADYCCFFRIHFPGREAPIPLSTMIAHLALAKKLRGLGRSRRILEIGPGCGYLSFFLKAWTDLEMYAQIESADSFYILQNLINKHVFSYRFRDHAQADWGAHNAARIGGLSGEAGDAAHAYIEVSSRLPVELPVVCRHYPWWRVDEAAEDRYDVVTSNANLTEFSHDAFKQYLRLIDRSLAENGCFFVQCLGGGPLSVEIILRGLIGIRLVPVVAMAPYGGQTIAGKTFVLPNFMFVRERHPLAAKYARPKLELPLLEPDDPYVQAVFFSPSGGPRRRVSATETLAAVTARLKDL